MGKEDRAGASMEEQLRAAGMEPKPFHAPRRSTPLLQIIIRAGAAPDLAVAATIVSLFKSACQDFSVVVVHRKTEPRRQLKDWLATDSRFSFRDDPEKEIVESAYTLVLNAGVALGVHSLVALMESLAATGATVLRALVDGQGGAIECWQTDRLRSSAESGDAERSARRAGGERWLSGSSLGLHDYRMPQPKLHLRKGAAGTLDLNVIVRDLRDPATRLDYEQRIRLLESRLKRSEIERRRLEQGLAPNRGISRARAIARKGPAYIFGRLKARTGPAGS